MFCKTTCRKQHVSPLQYLNLANEPEVRTLAEPLFALTRLDSKRLRLPGRNKYFMHYVHGSDILVLKNVLLIDQGEDYLATHKLYT